MKETKRKDLDKDRGIVARNYKKRILYRVLTNIDAYTISRKK